MRKSREDFLSIAAINENLRAPWMRTPIDSRGGHGLEAMQEAYLVWLRGSTEERLVPEAFCCLESGRTADSASGW